MSEQALPFQDVRTTAAQLGVHPQTVRRMVRSGRLPAYRLGHELRFDPDEIREALREEIPA